MKQRTHTLKITVTFDRACTLTHAVREVADCIHGEFYPTSLEASDPETFKVKKIARLSKSRAA